jgi:integrase
MKLTLRNVTKLTLPTGKTDFIWFDDAIAGFGLRIREGGSRSWIYQYRASGQQRRLVIGSASAVPLPMAREQAARLEIERRMGGDPLAKKEAARRETEITFGVLVDQYLQARMPSWRPSTAGAVTRHLKVYAKSLSRAPIGSISQRNIANLLNSVASKAGRKRAGKRTTTGEVSANRLRSSLQSFFAWVLGEGIRLPEGNPASHTNLREEKPRDRVLSDNELRTVWDAAGNNDYGRIVKLLMLTGQRAREIAALQWAEIVNGTIELPAARTKNKRPHSVPLSGPALAILAGVNRRNSIYLFGRGTTPFSGFSRGKINLDARIGALPPFSIHDLRRTAATGMADIGTQPHVIEAALNHVSGSKRGVAGVYNKSTYAVEVRTALERWGAHVTAIVEGRDTHVVPLRRA